jgi:hypothetical protein
VSHKKTALHRSVSAPDRQHGHINLAASARRSPVNACASTNVASMSAHRRPRGTMTDAVPMGYRVERQSKQDFENIAAALGISGAVLFEAMVEHTRSHLTTNGTPDWWTTHTPTQESPTDTA